VVTRLTLQTHELPGSLGAAGALIKANSDTAYRRLIRRFVAFYADNLFNANWGEIVTLRPGNLMDLKMVFHGLDKAQAETVWHPFFDWGVAAMPGDYAYRTQPYVITVPSRHVWDAAFLKANLPGLLLSDDRPGAPPGNVFWAGNLAEAGHF